MEMQCISIENTTNTIQRANSQKSTFLSFAKVQSKTKFNNAAFWYFLRSTNQTYQIWYPNRSSKAHLALAFYIFTIIMHFENVFFSFVFDGIILQFNNKSDYNNSADILCGCLSSFSEFHRYFFFLCIKFYGSFRIAFIKKLYLRFYLPVMTKNFVSDVWTHSNSN